MSENKANPLTDWDGFFKELQDESPRAAVIIASAFLDAQLRAILLNSFVDKKTSEELLDSDLSIISYGRKPPAADFQCKRVAHPGTSLA